MRLPALVAAAAALFVFAVPATASPVATDDGSYTVLGRVFPDPLAGCSNSGGACSPTANGNVAAQQFIGIDEFVDAINVTDLEDGGADPRAEPPHARVCVGAGEVPGRAEGRGEELVPGLPAVAGAPALHSRAWPSSARRRC